MENIKMALVTDDRDYGRALGLGILSVCRSMMIRIFTKDEFAALTEDEGDRDSFAGLFDMIVRDCPPADDGTDSLFLTERMGEKGGSILYRYSPARIIASEILDVHRRRTGSAPEIFACDGARVLTFASWRGGTGCSTLAMSVAEEITRYYGKRSMYISLEESESTSSFIEGEGRGRNAGQYMYYLLKDREHPPLLDGFTVRSDHGVEAFAPSRGRNPLRTVNGEDLMLLLRTLSESGRYDFLIIDSGTSMDDLSLSCMDMSEKVCLVWSGRPDFSREARFVGHIICRLGERVMDRAVKVENMAAGNEEGEKDPIVETHMRITRSRQFTDGNMAGRVFLEGEYGRDISRLTESLIDLRQT